MISVSALFASVFTLVSCGAANLQEQRPLSLGSQVNTSTPPIRSEASITGKNGKSVKSQNEKAGDVSGTAGAASGPAASTLDGKLGIQSASVSPAKSVPQSTVNTVASSSSGGAAVGSSGAATGATSGKASADASAQDIAKSAADADLERFRNRIQYVSYVYLACLGREADGGGLVYWSNLLATGQSSFDEVKFAICNQSLEGKLSIAYREILGRFPDAGGRASWLDLLSKGTSIEAVRAQIMASAEKQSLTSEQFLTRTMQINAVIQGYEVLLADMKRRTI